MIIRPLAKPLVGPLDSPLRPSMPWELGGGGASSPLLLAPGRRLILDERGLTVTSSVYSAWADQSGAGSNFTASVGQRPEDDTLLNGYAAPHFDGSDDFFTGPTASTVLSLTGFHGYLVFRPDVHDAADGSFFNEDYVIGDLNGNCGVSIGVSGIHAGIFTGAATNMTTRDAVSDGTTYLFEWSYDGTTLSSRLAAGTTRTVASAAPASLSTAVVIGDRGGANYDGKIAFIAVYNVKHNASTANSIRAFLGAKYAVTV